MLTKATAHLRPFIHPLASSNAGPGHFTSNPSLLHHLPHSGSGNIVAQGPNPTQTSGSSGSAGRHGYGGNAGAGGGYTGHARAFLSLPQTSSVDPSSTLTNSDDYQQDPSTSTSRSSLLLKHRLSKRTRIIGPHEGPGREVRREIEARAGGSKVTVLELENGEENERLSLPSTSTSTSDRNRNRRRSSIAFPTPSSDPSSSRSLQSQRPSTPTRHQQQRPRAGLTRSPSAVEIWQVGIPHPHPRASLGLRSLSTRSVRSLEAEDVADVLVSTRPTLSTRVLGQPNRVLMDLAGRDIPNKRPGMVRRNSTAAVERSSLDQPPVELLLQGSQDPSSSPDSRKGKTPGPDAHPREVAIHDALMEARNADDAELVDRLIRHYRSPRSVSPFSDDQQPGDPTLFQQYPLSDHYSLRTYNACLSALVGIRRPGQSISDILEIYNEILERDLIPNNVTYGFVVRALSLRAVEVSEAVKQWEEQKSWGEWRALLLGPEADTWDFEGASQKDRLYQSYIAEGNLQSAHKLFRAATRVNSSVGFPLVVYGTILDAMSREGQPDIQGMNQIMDMAKRWRVSGNITLYKYIFRAYGVAKDPQGLSEAWLDFQKEATKKAETQEGWAGSDPNPKEKSWRVNGIRHDVYQHAVKAFILAGQPQKAFEIVDSMMETATVSSSAEAENVDFAKPPPATHRTLGKVIVDLARAGEIDLALEWNEKIHSPAYLGKIQPSRMTLEHTAAFIDALIKAGRINEAKNLVQEIATQKHSTSASRRTVSRRLWRIYTALVTKATQAEIADEQGRVLDEIKEFSRGGAQFPLDILLLNRHLAMLAKSQRWDDLVPALAACAIQDQIGKDLEQKLQAMISAISETEVPYRVLLGLTRQFLSFGIPLSNNVASTIVYKYTQEQTSITAIEGSDEKAATSTLSIPELYVLLESFATLPTAQVNEGDYDEALLSLVSTIEQSGKAEGNDAITLIKNHVSVRTVIGLLVHRFGIERSKHLLTPIFGEEQAEQLTQSPAIPTAESVSSPSSLGSPSASEDSGFTIPSSGSSATGPPSVGQPEYKLWIDKSLSLKIDKFTYRNAPISLNDAYNLVKEGLKRNAVPLTSTLCSLIDHLSRQGDEPKVRELYGLCQVILNTVIRPENQSSAWHQVEDSMLIACCHLGHLEQAGMHRARIVEAGLAPSADAYATMIASSKDTTDDALVARELFDESQMMGVKPHLYLYNTIISKLSKARKAETALELFGHMKAQGIRPSSVTYGAVINACCRVGDAQSAETLFEEMASQPNFKARVPPFNTMMQFYLQTQPNRARVLHYYALLQNAHVPPSAHTYKLLLDTYATLAPIDLEAMENVFAQIQQDRNIKVQGTHWASLITAYGIHGNNLEKSREIFESIATSTKDAVVWEAMLNVLSQKGSLEDLESLKAKMINDNVQATAYVYNALINGYARNGRIEKAREVFESMGDSISGVAAPNNHPNLLTSSGHLKPNTITSTPTNMVFREPSTYESMIKAEVQHGSKENAKVVLDKMEERSYPLAVFLRGKTAYEGGEGVAVSVSV
ncbi:uncharacterized protein I303_102414 [Kwoniella dejecticola CBS 10117]|uniref:Pentatricopeptide repeat protein n=1 Tax=Kwoniella dejecticola CBS 10117 TaxID=1296121 RepID=A0A1A6A8P0_9TREE|nr:uncharacterized protein I303_02429 [Kwoniella dejecticola CBS 10117]OBR86422.1 hypothetical protein I303_02429 [Kwoniella dejecticola CBS 10117]